MVVSFFLIGIRVIRARCYGKHISNLSTLVDCNIFLLS